MEQFIEDFSERCEEVEEYFKFASFLDKIATNKKQDLYAEDHYGNRLGYRPTVLAQQILRSNFYLLIYNLVESTVNSLITTVIDRINDERLPLIQLKDQLRKLYLRDILYNKKGGEKTVNCTMEILGHIEKKRYVPITLSFGVSGNVDYKFIINVLNKIGCSSSMRIQDEDLLKGAFERSKKYRNELAHGDERFSSIGATKIIKNIEEDYFAIKNFYLQVLRNLEKFLDQKEYMKNQK